MNSEEVGCGESYTMASPLIESGYYDDAAILEQCIEAKKLLISSVNTAKNNKE